MSDDDGFPSDGPERQAQTSRETIASDRALIRQMLAATRALRFDAAHTTAHPRWLVRLSEARRAGNAEEAETRRA